MRLLLLSSLIILLLSVNGIAQLEQMSLTENARNDLTLNKEQKKSKFNISIHGGVNYAYLNAEDFDIIQNLNTATPITGTDNQYELFNTVRRTIIIHEFDLKPSLEVSGILHIPLKNGFEFSSGLRISSRRFDYSNDFLSSVISIELIDTIEITPNNGGGGGFQCDEFTRINEPPSIEEFRQIEHLHFLLDIPFSLQYTVPRRNIRFELGGFLSFPLFTRISNWTTDFETEEIGTRTICTLAYVQNHNTSRDDFSLITLGLQGAVHYAVTPKIWVSLGVRQYMQRIFKAPSESNGNINPQGVPSSIVRPLNLNLNVGYQF